MTRRAMAAGDLAPGSTTLAIVLPSSAAQMADLQAEAENDAEGIEEFKIDSIDRYQAADQFLTETIARTTAITAMRGEATGPMYQAIRTVEGWFRPTLTALKKIETHFRSEMKAFNDRRDAAERAERARALEAAKTGDHAGIVSSLAKAADLGRRVDAGAGVVYRWTVESIDAEKLPAEWWAPNVEAIQMHASATPAGQEPDPIPGVTFKRESTIRAKRS